MPNRGRPKKVQTPELSGFDAERAYKTILSRVDELEVRVAKLEIVEIKEEIKETQKVETTPTSIESAFPVPSDYRDVIISTLNSKFGVKIDYHSNLPEFSLTIVVPQEYSNISEAERRAIGGDLRSRVIQNADGINGVRVWTEKVYNSFSPEMKAKIKAEI